MTSQLGAIIKVKKFPQNLDIPPPQLIFTKTKKTFFYAQLLKLSEFSLNHYNTRKFFNIYLFLLFLHFKAIRNGIS